jgi:hypothetical protein
MSEKQNEGWVDPIPCNDWTLYHAAREIDNEACRRAAKQFQHEGHQDQQRFSDLVCYYKREMWELAQQLLMAEYACLDLENFSYQLQYFAIDGPEDPDDLNQYPEPDILGDAKEDIEGVVQEFDSIPSADELKDWVEGA